MLELAPDGKVVKQIRLLPEGKDGGHVYMRNARQLANGNYLVTHYGAEKIGCLVIPAGAGNSKRQIQLMQDFETTVIHIIPSYALHLSTVFAEVGVDPRCDTKVRLAFLGAEPHSEKMRQKIEEFYGFKGFNSYGLSEMNGPGVAFECEHKAGMHLWEDNFLLEIINPATGEPVAEGEILVKFKASVPQSIRDDKHRKEGHLKIRELRGSGVHQVRISPALTVEQAIARYRADSIVEYAEPNYALRAMRLPNDTTGFNLLWGMNNTGQTLGTVGADIRAPLAWDLATGKVAWKRRVGGAFSASPVIVKDFFAVYGQAGWSAMMLPLIFGLLWGTLLVSFASSIGATLAFLAVRAGCSGFFRLSCQARRTSSSQCLMW